MEACPLLIVLAPIMACKWGDAAVSAPQLQQPGGWENYIRELGEAAKAGPLTQEVMGRIAPKYDFEARNTHGG
jgi:hypothetical protein